MSYSKEELDDLLQDDAFVLWVLQPVESNNQYGNNWLLQNPGKEELLLKAKELVMMLHKVEKEALTADEKEQLTTGAWNTINDRINNNDRVVYMRKPWYKYAIAASVIGLAGLAVLFFQKITRNTPDQTPGGLVINKINQAELQFTNSAAKPQVIYLVDGSTITLEKNSSVQYARFLQPDKREVHLEGEAFFTIAKDASRPFYVYVHGIAVKVLGTSFRIVTNKKDGKITVAVKTGKVSVFRNDSELQKETLVLLPHQQAVFDSEPNTLVKTEVSDSSLLEQHAEITTDFSFDNKPVSEIIEKLSGVYAVDISYDKEKFSKCGGITVLLNEATLEGKLAILSKVLGASYRINNDKIWLEGNGCD